ncbi:mediator of RNA polymerase II transcription subunit 8 [Lambiella insularis]|nr:mediator of RNA polymerase II transcription subunit 8 [Lambiella insularis]
MSQQLNTNYDLFSAMPVYPLPLYPAQTQEPLLEQLLRKKLEPKVEDWAAEGRKIAIEATEEGSNCYSQSEMNDLWSWAGMAANEEARKHTWGGNYTLEEEEIGVENVVTGLLRKLKADPDDSSEEEDDEEEAVQAVPDPDEMEVVGVHRKEGGDGVEFDIRWQSQYRPTEPNLNALPINDTFRFLMTGSMPSKS